MARYAVTYIFEAYEWGHAIKLNGYASMELQPNKTLMFVELTDDTRF